MDKDTVKDIARDVAKEIAMGVLLRYGKLNEMTVEQQMQLNSDTKSIAEIVIIDAFQPFLVKNDY